MKTMLVFHMNKGEGDTSYAKNSIVQRKIISTANSIIEEAVVDILCNMVLPAESMGIADLGCSSGPNSLMVIYDIMDFIHTACLRMGRSPPAELRVSLNDLPGNDFNHVFESLPAFYQKLREEKGAGFRHCFVAGVPGSFYGRLFPSRSLHLVHSSSSLHWLSQVPACLDSNASVAINKGKIYISRTSPQCVLEAYLWQFQEDFWEFLRSRSQEMVPGGRMVLSFMGRTSPDATAPHSCYHWELLAQALMTLVSQGVIEEEKIDSLNAPYYAPSIEEVKRVVEGEGSFMIERIEWFEVEWDGGVREQKGCTRGQQVANTIRAVVESMLESHFGKGVICMDGLFRTYSELVEDHLAKHAAHYINLVVSLLKP